MARKSNRTTPTPAGAVPNPFAIGHDTGYGHYKKQPRIDHPSNGRTPQVAPKNSTGSGSEESSTYRTSDDAIAIADGDVSDADAVEADEEDGDDEDGDALAPSGRAIEAYGDQAGRTNIGGDSRELVVSRNKSGLGRHNQATQPTRSSKRNTKSYDGEGDSDDEAYNAVDSISHSDEDEPRIEKLEEKQIVATAYSRATSETSDTWDGFDFEDGVFSSDMDFSGQQMGHAEPSMLDSEVELFPSDNVLDDFEPMPPQPQSSSPPKRRVRFQDPIFSFSDSSDITSNDEGIYGLFNSNLRPDKGRNQQLESKAKRNDDENKGSPVGSSSGYGTDYGQTTDEEDAPAYATTNPQLLLRQPSLFSLGNDASATLRAVAAPRPLKVPAPPAGYRQGPRMGSFIANRTKPFVMIDSTGDNLIITPAKKRPAISNMNMNLSMGSTKRSTANASPVTSQPTIATAGNDSDVYHSNAFNMPVNPTLPSHSESMADVLLPIGPQDHIQSISLMSGNVVFPRNDLNDVNAFYAADDHDDNSNDSENILNIEDIIDVNALYAADDHDDNSNDSDNVLNIEDFIEFSVDLSENNEDQLDLSLPTPISISPTGASANAQPKIPPQSNSAAYDLMANLDKGVIGKFRQGQNHHQQQTHYSQLGMSFDSHALEGGRCAPATSPLSPPKKRKLSGSFGASGSLGPAAKKTVLNHC